MKTIAGVLFVAGLCFAGCATEPSPEAGESTASQEVSTGVRCSDKSWKVNFYSDATLTTVVGTMSCVCLCSSDVLESITEPTSPSARAAYGSAVDSMALTF